MCELELRIGKHIRDNAGNVFIPELGWAINYQQEAGRHPDRSFSDVVEIVRSARPIQGVPTAVVEGITYHVVPDQPLTRDGRAYTLVRVVPQSTVIPS